MHVSNFCMCFEKLHLMKDSCSTSHKWHLYVDCFPLKMRYCEIIGRRNWDVRWARCLLAHTSFSKWQILSSSAFIRTEVSSVYWKKWTRTFPQEFKVTKVWMWLTAMILLISYETLPAGQISWHMLVKLVQKSMAGRECTLKLFFYSYWVGFCENSKYSPSISNILVKWKLCDAS